MRYMECLGYKIHSSSDTHTAHGKRIGNIFDPVENYTCIQIDMVLRAKFQIETPFDWLSSHHYTGYGFDIA